MEPKSHKHLLEDVLFAFVKLSQRYKEQSLRYVEATAKIAKLKDKNIYLKLQYDKLKQENKELREGMRFMTKRDITRGSTFMETIIQVNGKAIPRTFNFYWNIVKNSKSLKILTKKSLFKKYFEQNKLLNKKGTHVIGCDIMI